MTEIFLNISQIHTGFEEMGGIGMSQVMDRNLFVNANLESCLFKDALNIFERDRSLGIGHHPWASASAGSRKNPDWIAMGFIEVSQDL